MAASSEQGAAAGPASCPDGHRAAVAGTLQTRGPLETGLSGNKKYRNILKQVIFSVYLICSMVQVQQGYSLIAVFVSSEANLKEQCQFKPKNIYG